jgi:hypothetical protein
MITKIHLAAIAVVGTVALGGCSTFPEKFQWTEAKVVEAAWLKPRPQAVTPVYCYRTIGSAMCYAWPRKYQESRLLGYAGPAPY